MLFSVAVEWTANFDSEGVAMDTLDAAAVGWVDSSATSVVEVTDEAGFADFTDITKFSWLVTTSSLTETLLILIVRMEKSVNFLFILI